MDPALRLECMMLRFISAVEIRDFGEIRKISVVITPVVMCTVRFYGRSKLSGKSLKIGASNDEKMIAFMRQIWKN